MNHQIQANVLVDGEWVSRPVDVYQAMARAHAQDSDSDMSEPTVQPSHKVPELGILSRTIFASPLFKSVLSANIRHKDLNDVVLVGEDTIQLKEIRDYGQMRHVATKSDFKGRILAARVFGDPREVPVSVGSPLPRKQTLHRARRSMTGDEGHVPPPELIVLTLTSRTLMFLWAEQTRNSSVAFMQRTVSLPAGSSPFDRFGAFLAIDSKVRAMAVAAREGRFILYKTKSIERWRGEVCDGHMTTPIEDERIISIDGQIMHMEFLSSATLDEFHVVLLFIVASQAKTKIVCFDWDCREDLDRVAVRAEWNLVDLEDHNPSLLIPLSRTSEFLMVFDTHISAYRDVLSGAPRRTTANISPNVLPSLLPGDSKRRPHWVAWDRTPRNKDFPKEVFYVAREDGRIMYAERSPTEFNADEAGDWPHRIDTAFACLSVDNSEFSQLYPDVLIAGGAGTDGRLCKVGSWPAEYSYSLTYLELNKFSDVDTIPSWMPLTDLSVTKLTGVRVPYERDRESIFTANGLSPQGEISELRYGVRASVEHSFGGMIGCTGVWVVDNGSHTVQHENKTARQHYATFALTLPPETLLVRVVRTQHDIRGEYSGAWEDGVWDQEQMHAGEDGFMRDVETLSACIWSDNITIQITPNEIRTMRRPTLQQIGSLFYDKPILLATCRPTLPFIVVTFRDSGVTHLELAHISSQGNLSKASSQNARLQLEYDPTCIEIFTHEGHNYVFVSTFDLKIFLLKVEADGSLVTVVEDSLEGAAIRGARMLLESAVLLSTNDVPVLVCATRSGYILSSPLFALDSEQPSFTWHAVKMGTTSVQITASSTDPSTAFASCGAGFCRVRRSARNASVLDINSIWFTKKLDASYVQSQVTAMYQLPHITDATNSGRNMSGLLVAVSGEQLLFSQLDSDALDNSALPQDGCRTVPRKLRIGAKPTNVIYTELPRKMVVSTMEAKEERAPPHGYRVLHSTLKLLNMDDEKTPNETEVKEEDDNALMSKLVAAELELKHGERVYSIAKWDFTDHRSKKYNLLIVGTGVPSNTGKETGRRLIINTGQKGTKLHVQKESVFDSPVYCTAVFGNDTSISAIGKTLTFDVFNPEKGLLRKVATETLPSPAVHITVRAPYVYVSTLQHSHLCFVALTDFDDFKFERVFTDSRERNCASHLVCRINDPDDIAASQDRYVLITDKKSSSITALYHPSERIYKNAAHTLFEACLPRTVIRLQQGDIRPPWRRSAYSSQPPPGVLADDVIGACSDGTIYTFSILSKPAHHLLRLLQNLIEEKEKRNPAKRNTPIYPRSGAIQDMLMNGAEGNQDTVIRALDVDPTRMERGQGGPRFKHVDGDLLERWISEDGDLRALIEKDTDHNVAKLFEQFVEVMWNVDNENLEIGMVKVKEWLDEVFMPVL